MSVRTLLVMALVGAMGAGCGRDGHDAHSPGSKAPKSVPTINIERMTTTAEAEAPGAIEPVQQAHLAPKVMAKVRAVSVVAGDRVRRGQLLVALESGDLQAQVGQASASVSLAKAGRAQALTALGMQRVNSAADVEQAEAAVRAARANLEKTKRGPRKEQRGQAELAVTQAKAALDAAEARLDLVREGARRQEKVQAAEAVRQAEQGLVAAEAAARTAEADYNRMKALLDQEVIPEQRFDHARLQHESAQAGLIQAQAALAQAKQQESIVQEGARTQEVRQAEEGVNQARAAHEQAKLELQMADIGGREEDVTAAEATVSQAEEALRNARAAMARDELRKSDVTAAAAGIERAEAGLRSAQVMLGYTGLTAPFNGIVTARRIDPGSMATPGIPLLTVEDDSSYRLVATVPERLAAHLRVGASVRAVIDALGADWQAEIVEIVPAADPASHTFIAKAELPEDNRIRTGLFGRLVFPTGERETILVPDAAIWRQGSLTGVFVIHERTARLRMVQLGPSREGRVEVNSGLKEGERIAADATGLRDGDAVSSGGETAP